MARAGRFGTKGLAITFVSDETDAKVLNEVQERFEVNITELPDEIDISSYSKFSHVCLNKMLLIHVERFDQYSFVILTIFSPLILVEGR